MAYREATAHESAFFQEHGWLVVEDAIAPGDLAEAGARMEKILEHKHRFAFDWAWEKGKDRDDREFKIVQGMPSRAWRGIADTAFRRWMIAFAFTKSAMFADSVSSNMRWPGSQSWRCRRPMRSATNSSEASERPDTLTATA